MYDVQYFRSSYWQCWKLYSLIRLCGMYILLMVALCIWLWTIIFRFCTIQPNRCATNYNHARYVQLSWHLAEFFQFYWWVSSTVRALTLCGDTCSPDCASDEIQPLVMATWELTLSDFVGRCCNNVVACSGMASRIRWCSNCTVIW